MLRNSIYRSLREIRSSEFVPINHLDESLFFSNIELKTIICWKKPQCSKHSGDLFDLNA